MKRLLFVFAIIMVMAVVGFYIYNEFSIEPIVYVSDTSNLSSKGNEIMIYRLYVSEVNVDEFTAQIENSAISTEFSEEEILAAAIASGAPKFYPAFFLSLFHPDTSKNEYVFQGAVRQAYAKNQKSSDYVYSNVNVELISEGLSIENAEFTPIDESADAFVAPVISEDKTSMIMNLDNVSEFKLNFGGARGMLTFQFTYDIVSSSFFSSPVLEGQLLIVYATVSVEDNGALNVSYILEPYSSLEEYADYQ